MGVYDSLPPYLSNAIGAYETTLIRLASGYAQFVNGGKKVASRLIDRIQDRNGATIYREDPRACDGCNTWDWHSQAEPLLPDTRAADARSAHGLSDRVAASGRGAVRHRQGR